MALNIETQYPGRVTASDANYPYGSAKNETSPGAGDGTPYELARANDVFGLQQSLLYQAGIVPTGSADTAVSSQYLGSLLELASRARYFADTGAADAYVVDPVGNVQAPVKYFDGMEVIFTPANANTGASTVDVGGLGAKSVTRQDGTALTAGAILSGVAITLRFDLANDRFYTAGPATQAEQEAASAQDVEVTPANQHFHPTASKAWVNFDGTGVVSIISSYNVSSITDNDTGNYTINFTNAFADTNYAFVLGGRETTGTQSLLDVSPFLSDTKTTGSFQLRTHESTSAVDAPEVCACFFGDQ